MVPPQHTPMIFMWVISQPSNSILDPIAFLFPQKQPFFWGRVRPSIRNQQKHGSKNLWNLAFRMFI